MTYEFCLRLIMIGLGLVFLIWDYAALVQKKMVDLLAIGWLILSIVIILMGAVPHLSRWTWLVSFQTGVTIIFVFAVVLYFVFKICFWISSLYWQNRELAMQVSLLNEENMDTILQVRRLEEKIEKLEGKN